MRARSLMLFSQRMFGYDGTCKIVGMRGPLADVMVCTTHSRNNITSAKKCKGPWVVYDLVSVHA